MIVPIVIKNPQIPEEICTNIGYGLIDNCASNICTRTSVSEELGLRTVRIKTMVTAHGKSRNFPIFYVNMTISIPRNRITISYYFSSR